MGTEDHPVWTLYDKLRSTCLSCKYYGRRLAGLETQNFWLELILAAAAPGSALAGLFFWQTEVGQFLWRGLGILAAAVAVIKPLLHLPKRIKDFESQLSAYRMLDADLRELKAQVEQRRRFDAGMQAELRRITQREKTLAAKNPESVENLRIKTACFEEVKRELPLDSFYIPKDHENG